MESYSQILEEREVLKKLFKNAKELRFFLVSIVLSALFMIFGQLGKSVIPEAGIIGWVAGFILFIAAIVFLIRT